MKERSDSALLTRRVLLGILMALAGSGAIADNRWIEVPGSWPPAGQMLGEMKAQLRPYVENEAKRQSRKLRPWSQYIFQYQAQEDGGRRYVLVNAFCRKDPAWQLDKQLVRVLDGGTCYFHAMYDSQRHRYYEVFINGEA